MKDGLEWERGGKKMHREAQFWADLIFRDVFRRRREKEIIAKLICRLTCLHSEVSGSSATDC